MIQSNLTWTLLAGASPAPASWAAMEAMLYATAAPEHIPQAEAQRGRYGEVKNKLMEAIRSNPGLRTRQLSKLLPQFSSNRVCCAASQLFIDGKVRRTGTYGRYAYFPKEE